MPELPDVEIHKRYIDATSLHKRIEHVHVHDESLLEDASRQKLASRLVGASLEATSRHGKYLGARLDSGDWLVLHFGMTGSLEAASGGGEPDSTALRLEFAGGAHLDYINKRRLGTITVTPDLDAFIEQHDLGPDAGGMELDTFRELLEGRRGSIKALLMNQEAIAGLGNVYSDEMLYQAGIDPERTAGDLTEDEVTRLHRTMSHVLETAIEHEANPDDMPTSWLLPNRTEDADCPRCGGRIRKKTVSGRATYWCRECQGQP